MHQPIRCLKVALSAILPCVVAAPACAQFRVPDGTYDPSLQTQAVARPVGGSGYVPVNPAYSYTGYPYGYRQTPLNGTLTGVADLTTATGQYYQQIEQAKLTQEQVKRSQMDSRRKVFEEFEYEQNKTREMQQRKKFQDEADVLYGARNNPPPTSIWSGDTLNVLLKAIQGVETNYGIRGTTVPLDQQGLEHINVSTGTTFGSVGLFRDGRPLSWPLSLQEDRFQAARENIDALSAKAVRSVAKGSPDGKALRDLIAAVAALKEQVTAATNDQSPSDNIRAMRYVNELRDGVRTLTDPNAANLLVGKWSAKGESVGDLVANLTRSGLKFAPASSGDEPYYTALYQAILSYDASLRAITGSR